MCEKIKDKKSLINRQTIFYAEISLKIYVPLPVNRNVQMTNIQETQNLLPDYHLNIWCWLKLMLITQFYW